MLKINFKKGLYVEVPLFPTDFILDVWLCSNHDKICANFDKFYGIIDPEAIVLNSCNVIETSEDSYLEGEIRIVIILDSFHLPNLVHEINHALWCLSILTNLEVNKDTQEWSSYMLGYMTDIITGLRTSQNIDEQLQLTKATSW